MLPLLLAFTTAAPPPKPPNTPAPEKTWERMFPPVDACAPLAIQPFYKQPRVCRVAVCDCDDTGTAGRKEGRTWVKEFSSAAHVPIPRFDQDGHPVCGDGLIVYEGMRLTVDPDTGLYDLNFTATVPNTSVVLRMQLSFTSTAHAHWKHVDGVPTPDRYTLTLPPIAMHPPQDAKPGDPTGTTFHVAHRGYSSLFLERRVVPLATEAPGDKKPVLIDRNWEVRRDGTARFGTPVAIEDPNR